MEYETNYNEKLRNESIASVKEMLNYAMDKITSPSLTLNKDELQYFIDVVNDCDRELELRIKQIFP